MLSLISHARLTSKWETSRGLIVRFILPWACELKRAVISDPKIEELLKGNLLPADGSRNDRRKKLNSCQKFVTLAKALKLETRPVRHAWVTHVH